MILATFHVLLLLAFAWFFIQKKSDPSLHKWLWVGLGIRLIAAMSFGLIYVSFLGEGDTIFFFERANSLATIAKTDAHQYLDFIFSKQYPYFKAEARNGFFVKILSLFSSSHRFELLDHNSLFFHIQFLRSGTFCQNN